MNVRRRQYKNSKEQWDNDPAGLPDFLMAAVRMTAKTGLPDFLIPAARTTAKAGLPEFLMATAGIKVKTGLSGRLTVKGCVSGTGDNGSAMTDGQLTQKILQERVWH